MTWTLDKERPIYLQLMERIEQSIISGIYKPGERLPSVRELATEAAVNPNTMQKALTELERGGLVFSQRTSGRFITEDEKLLTETKREIAKEHIRHFFENMSSMGYDAEETLKLLEEFIQEEGLR